MRDKHSTGQVDTTKDHHMIGGCLVPVVERAPNRAQKSRSTKRQKTASGGKAAEAAPKSHT